MSLRISSFHWNGQGVGVGVKPACQPPRYVSASKSSFLREDALWRRRERQNAPKISRKSIGSL